MADLVGPAWAYGCSECTYGLVLNAPVSRSSMSFYQVRRIQAGEEIIVFCECQAGQAYKRWALQKATPVVKPVAPTRPQAPRANIYEMAPAMAEERLDIYA